MGLFKKKINDTSNKENASSSEVEIIDFSTNEKVENTLETRKENRILFIILGVVVIFAFSLPFLSNLLTKNSVFHYNNQQEEINENNTIDGMIEIDQDAGNITAKKIKFYNAIKQKNNELNITYLPESRIKNVNSLNIYIEIYNKNKKLVNRTKFVNNEELDRKVQGKFVVNLNETIYKESAYVKIVIIDDDEWGKANETLVCTKNPLDNDFNLTYTTTYRFSDLGLVKYNVKKEASITEKADIDVTVLPEEILNKYKNEFKKESEELSKNITDIFLEDNTLEYTVDLNIDNISPLYEKGSTKRQIKLAEVKAGWSCE